MNICDHEDDHDSIVIYNSGSKCGICFLLEELEEARADIKALNDDIDRLVEREINGQSSN
uniref:Uncharacterized protein n=1 Tax=viral metagenome TaxID=1070528 RepID=A0A6M3K678_9ZZZZ